MTRSRSSLASRAAALALVALISTWEASASRAEGPISLAGEWRFGLDRDDRGLAGEWFRSQLPERIMLPGMLQAQGYGDTIRVDTAWTGQIVDRSFFEAAEYAPYREPGRVKVPFWLQPDRHYVGAAWYQRDVTIPEAWKAKRIELTLERPHIETRVWLDDREIGRNDSLSTAHVYDLGTQARPGPHRLTVRVDNRLVVDVGVNSHSVTDHTQGNWNGVVGRIELAATGPVWVEDLQVFPHVKTRSVTVQGRVANSTGGPGNGVLSLTAGASGSPGEPLGSARLPISWTAQGGGFTTELTLGPEARTWDEFQPAVYSLNARLEGDDVARSVTFGLREIATEGTQFTINGRKTFFRGTLECAIFPQTGYPPTDLESWRRLIRIAKDHGLNEVRFHSWCPPEAAFQAADELGFYFHVECASWANTSTALGQGKPIDDWLYDEADRILKAYGNHPSFVMLAYGNEPAGKDKEYLAKWVERYKKRDGRRLYTSAAGWPQIPENQFHVLPDPRIQAWGEGLKSRINARPPETRTDYRDYIQARAVPVISHEIGQWCVFPDLAEIGRYTGPYKARNFEIFRDSLEAHGLTHQAHDFLIASGKLQALCYKEEVEAALRTPGMGGFELLSLQDFPGQGTALVGVLNPFWESKGYVTAADFRRFCGPTVPLARLPKRVWTLGETLRAELEVAHFGPGPLRDIRPSWKLVDEQERVAAHETLPARTIDVGNGIGMGPIAVPLQGLAAPRRYRLIVELGAVAINEWDVWVYPEAGTVPNATPADVAVVTELDGAAEKRLSDGGKVLWLLPPARVRNDERAPVLLGFSSIFWNTAWTRRQAPTTLGILCDPSHPSLAGFPTEPHTNWQWWYLVSRAQPMILDALPRAERPIVQVIDDWFTNRRLGLVLEAKVGPGKLLACSIDLSDDQDGNPVARQLRASLLSYTASDRFAPRVELTVAQLRGLASPSAQP